MPTDVVNRISTAGEFAGIEAISAIATHNDAELLTKLQAITAVVSDNFTEELWEVFETRMEEAGNSVLGGTLWLSKIGQIISEVAAEGKTGSKRRRVGDSPTREVLDTGRKSMEIEDNDGSSTGNNRAANCNDQEMVCMQVGV